VEFSTVYGKDGGIERDVPLDRYDDEKFNRGVRFGLFHFRRPE
jgi:hypothetical protein